MERREYILNIKIKYKDVDDGSSRQTSKTILHKINLKEVVSKLKFDDNEVEVKLQRLNPNKPPIKIDI